MIIQTLVYTYFTWIHVYGKSHTFTYIETNKNTQVHTFAYTQTLKVFLKISALNGTPCALPSITQNKTNLIHIIIFLTIQNGITLY